MTMCSLANRANPSGFEGTLDPVALDALLPLGLVQFPVGVVVFDTELRIAWVNETAERLIGGPPAAGWAGRRLGEGLPGMDAGLIERSLRRGPAPRAPGCSPWGRRRGGGQSRAAAGPRGCT